MIPSGWKWAWAAVLWSCVVGWELLADSPPQQPAAIDPARTIVIHLQHGSAGDVAALLQQSSPGLQVGVDSRSNSVLLVGPDAALDAATALAQLLDQPAKESPTSQIDVEFALVEQDLPAVEAQAPAADAVNVDPEEILDRQNRLAGHRFRQDYRLRVTPNQSAMLQVGSTVPMPEGRTLDPASRSMRTMFVQRAVGSILRVTANVEESGEIAMEYQLELSRPGQPDSPEAPAPVESTTSSSTLRLKPGQAVVVCSFTTRTADATGDRASRMLILARARVLPP